MKTINTDYIASLNPCYDRFENWKEKYPDWSGGLSEFLDLTEITHSDKCWVFFRSIDLKLIPLVAADFAERVLVVFENKFQGDLRPRKAIEAARSGGAAYAAADAAYAAADAADAAADAAYDAARAAYDAARAAYADYAAANAAADAAYDAARAAYDAARAAYADYAAGNRNIEERAQIEIMKKYLRGNP